MEKLGDYIVELGSDDGPRRAGHLLAVLEQNQRRNLKLLFTKSYVDAHAN